VGSLLLVIVDVVVLCIRHDRHSAASSPSRNEHGLLPAPIHVGKYLREKRVDFRLPYDIWWLHNSGVVGTAVVYILVLLMV